MKRIVTLLFCVLCGVSLAAEKPNIVLILADDPWYETIGANGGSSYKTLEIEKLAATGTRVPLIANWLASADFSPPLSAAFPRAQQSRAPRRRQVWRRPRLLLQCWEGGIRVPFFVQWKSHLRAGRGCDLWSSCTAKRDRTS